MENRLVCIRWWISGTSLFPTTSAPAQRESHSRLCISTFSFTFVGSSWPLNLSYILTTATFLLLYPHPIIMSDTSAPVRAAFYPTKQKKPWTFHAASRWNSALFTWPQSEVHSALLLLLFHLWKRWKVDILEGRTTCIWFIVFVEHDNEWW